MGTRSRQSKRGRSSKEKKTQQRASTDAPVKTISQDVATAKAEKGYAYFTIGKEIFAFPLDRVAEVLHVYEIESVPHLPGMFVGVINLRGESMPVIDLRRILKEEITVTEQRTCVVTTVDASVYGFVVDSDIEIVTLEKDRMYPLPDLYTAEEARFIDGILWVGDKFIGVLNPKGILETFAQWRENAKE